MQEVDQYEPSKPLTYSSFLGAMAGFLDRHPAISSMEPDYSDNTDFAGCYFDGFINHQYEFTVSYDPGDQEKGCVEAVSVGIVLKNTLRQIDKVELADQTELLHRKYPETVQLSFYSIQTPEDIKFVIGYEFELEDAHTLGEMDMLFDILVRSVTFANRQFCAPRMLVLQPQKAN